MTRIETHCVHAGVKPDPVTGAIMTPIYQTSTFVQEKPGEPLLHDYSRAGNPTRDALETSMATLEGARWAYTFSSGLAAAQAVIQILEPDAHVLVSEDVYGGTGRLFRRMYAKYGLEFEFIDMRDPKVIEQHMTDKTRMIWIETPTNPLLRIVDVPAIAELTKDRDCSVLVDNTFCSPILQRPLEMGADLVLHSSTKYLAGHSDLVGGVVMTSDEKWSEELKFVQFAAGAVNAPQECFLLLRSIKTLALRMERHSTNALALAEALETMPEFEEVIYPGLPSHPQYDLAQRQMPHGCSGIVSAYLPGSMERVSRFMSNLSVFSLAESLGGVESLVNHPETMTHASVPPDLRVKLGIDAGLIRFSVGIENAEDLIEDVRRALEA
ncbi:MAG: PLP-dependent aspartate aminotransferase family protein [Acidobacteriota bacterium]|nr:PLP-dependent aspartate aminotransferase family protein [Acidobacteriota bacterium]